MAIQGGTVRWVVEADTSSFEASMKKVEESAKNIGKSVDEPAKQVDKSLQSIRASVKLTHEAFSQMAGGFKTLSLGSAQAGLASIGSTMTGLTAKGLSLGSTLESNKLSFKALTGSAESSREVLTAVADFAAENPFQMLDVSNVAKKFVAMSIPAKDVARHLNTIGKVSVASGASLEGIGHVFSQVAAQGKLMTQDMYQLVNQGVAIMPALSRVTGKSMEQLREDMSEGRISFELMTKAMNAIVPDDMAKQLQLEMFNTIPRQLDRLKGSISTFATELVGINKKTGDKLENGIAQSYTNILKELANGIRNPKLLASVAELGKAFAPLLQKVADKLPKLFDTLAIGVDKLAKNSKLLVPILAGVGVTFGGLASNLPVVGPIFGNLSGGVKDLAFGFMNLAKANPILAGIVALFTIGFANAYKNNEEFRNSIGRLVSALLKLGGNLGTALVPIIDAFTQIASSGAVVIILNSVVGALAGLAEMLAKIPSPVLTSLVMGLMAFKVVQNFTGPLQNFSKGLNTLSKTSKAAAPNIDGVGKALGSGLVSALKPLGANLVIIGKASLAIVALGAAIGVAIGAVGGGIFIFGKGLSALGQSFKDLGAGAQALGKADLSKFGTKLAQLAQGLSGVAPKFLDFTVAAATFPLIGIGIQELAKGMKALGFVKVKDFEKLPELANALKAFQIDFGASLFNGNILTKFKDLGDSVKSIADLMNIVTNIKIPTDKLKSTMSALSEGLKSFLITELQPSFLAKIFVADLKTSSVTDYLASLKNIVEPIQKFSDMQGKGLDSKKLKTNLQNIAEALKSFLIAEVQPSYIEQVFGKVKSIKVSSVTNYLQDLGGIVGPISSFNEMTQKDKFDGAKLTVFLRELAKSLKAFTIIDINTSSSEFFEMTKKSRTINRTSVLQYTENLKTVIDSLAGIQTLLQDKEGNVDAGEGQRITNFLTNLGHSLKAFTIKDISYEADEFLKGSVKIKTSTKSILDGANNFKSLADGVAVLAGLFKGDHKIDIGKISAVVQSIGETLRTFNVVDTDKEWKELLDRGGKVKTTHKNILGQIGNFNDFAKGVKTLTEITLNEKFDTQKIKNVMSSMKTFLSEFNMVNTESSWTKPFGESGSTKIVYSNILGQIGDFNNFANGVKTLVEATTIQNFNPAILDMVTGSIGAMISSLNIFTVEHTEKYVGGERTWKPKYDNALAHIGDFKAFAEGVKTIVEATTTQNFNPGMFDSVLNSVGTLIRLTVFRETESSQDYNLLGKILTKDKITSSLAHLGDFKNFAEGVKVIADLTSAQNFNPDTFNKVITNVFEAIKTLSLKETEIVKNGGWFGGGGSEKVNYSSALTKLGDFKGFVQSLSSLMALNIGDGAILKTLMTNVSEGVKKLLTISEIDTSPIDTEKLKALFSAIGTLKTNTTDWDTSGLAQKGLDIANFVKNVVANLNTEFDANVQKLSQLGTTMVTNIKNGITSALPQMQQAGADIQGKLWSAIEAKMMDEFWQGSTMATKFNEGLRSQLNAVAQSGRDMQGSFWNAIEPKMMDEYHQGRALAGKLIEGINSQRGGLENSGRHAVNGFLTGAENNWGSVYNMGVRMASRFLQGVKDRGDQHSPWKTTYQSGIFAGQGLVNGILSMEDSLYNTAWSVTDTVVGIFENMNDTFQPRIAPEISGAKSGGHFVSGGGNNGPRVIIEQTNNNYTQYSIDQMNRDLEWQLRKV